jgi:hypothetical protein
MGRILSERLMQIRLETTEITSKIGSQRNFDELYQARMTALTKTSPGVAFAR